MLNLKHSRRSLLLLVTTLSLGICSAVLPGRVLAEGDLKATTSLGFVPEDAGFYASTFRLREKYEAIVNSNAYNRLLEMPVLQQPKMLLQQQMFLMQAMTSNPQYQEPLALLGDMFSNEVFLYGDPQYADLFVLINRVMSSARLGQLQGQLGGGENAETEQARQMFLALKEHQDKLNIPNTVIGFKLTNTLRGENLLKQLELALQGALANDAELSNRFERKTISDHDHLTLTLDGEMLPWHELPLDSIEETEGEFDTLIEKIKKMTLTISLGVRDDHLLLGLGATADHLKNLDGDRSLYDHSELRPLRTHAGKTMSNVSYVSREFAEKVYDVESQINDLMQVVNSVLPLLPTDESVKEDLLADVEKVMRKVQATLPKPGATLSYDFTTDRGLEGYTYFQGENRLLDGSKTLPLLNHLGGNPIGFYAFRSRYSPENYQLFVEIAKLAFHYGEEIGLPTMSEREQDEYEKYRVVVQPLVERLHKVTEEKLIPSLKDGQAAFVFDAKSKSRQWLPQMPASDEPLPFPGFAFVYGVSDSKQLRSAFSDYFEILQELVNKVHEVSPQTPLPFQLEKPEVASSANGTIYHYRLPAEAGIDPKLSPSAGISEKVAAFSLFRAQSERLLESRELLEKSGPLAARKGPIAAACRFDWPGLVDVIKVWAKYGVKLEMGTRGVSLRGAEDDLANVQQDDAFADIMDQIDTGAEILKCFRGFSSVTYLEGSTTVTHRESVWQDLEE